MIVRETIASAVDEQETLDVPHHRHVTAVAVDARGPGLTTSQRERLHYAADDDDAVASLRKPMTGTAVAPAVGGADGVDGGAAAGEKENAAAAALAAVSLTIGAPAGV